MKSKLVSIVFLLLQWHPQPTKRAPAAPLKTSTPPPRSNKHFFTLHQAWVQTLPNQKAAREIALQISPYGCVRRFVPFPCFNTLSPAFCGLQASFSVSMPNNVLCVVSDKSHAGLCSSDMGYHLQQRPGLLGLVQIPPAAADLSHRLLHVR